MTRSEFWTLIEASRSEGSERWLQHERLESILRNVSSAEIISFAGHWFDMLALAARDDLSAAVWLIEGVCSDDGFEAFRAWLISEGQEFFFSVLENPDSLNERCANGVFYEDMLLIPFSVYRKASGSELPSDAIPIGIAPIDGRPNDGVVNWNWTREDLPKRFPKLWKAYGDADV
jgi:hypothetical protein